MEQGLIARALIASDVGGWRVAQRLFAFAVLSLVEVFITSFAFNLPTTLSDAINPVAYAKILAQTGLLSFVVLAVLLWPDREVIGRAWDRECRQSNLRTSVLVNLLVFGVLLVGTIRFSDIAAHSNQPPWNWFVPYCGLLLITGLSL